MFQKTYSAKHYYFFPNKTLLKTRLFQIDFDQLSYLIGFNMGRPTKKMIALFHYALIQMRFLFFRQLENHWWEWAP